MTAVVADVRSADPVAYIRAIGLRPEDSFGFVPEQMAQGGTHLFLYRDRPEYARVRAVLPPPDDVIRDLPLGRTALDAPALPTPPAPTEPSGALAAQLEQARGWVSPEVLAQLQAHAASAAGQEFSQQLADAQAAAGRAQQQVLAEVVGDLGTPFPVAEAPPGAPDLVAERVFPGLDGNRSDQQLDHWLPAYVAAVGLCPQDVYGVFPRGLFARDADIGTDQTRWDDYWIVYRDRPEYAAGRAGWADRMRPTSMGTGVVALGRRAGRALGMAPVEWPAAERFGGVAAAGAGRPAGRVAVEEERWPRKRLVLRKTGEELGDALREVVERDGRRPEDAFGFCPDMRHASIAFAWATG